MARPLRNGSVEVAELIEIVDNSDFGPKKLLFVPFSHLRFVPGFGNLLAVPEAGEGMVELVVL